MAIFSFARVGANNICIKKIAIAFLCIVKNDSFSLDESKRGESGCNRDGLQFLRFSVTDELELRSTAFERRSCDHVGRVRANVYYHSGARIGSEQLQSGQDAYTVRGRTIRSIQDDGRDSVGRRETASGFNSGHVFVSR